MNYNEFKNTYKFMVKNYPDTTTFYRDDNFIIGTITIERFKKVGKKWVIAETTTETADNIYYCNVVGAIPFFRGLGGYEGVDKKYTKYGFIPYKINSINPNKTEKTIRTFNFN